MIRSVWIDDHGVLIDYQTGAELRTATDSDIEKSEEEADPWTGTFRAEVGEPSELLAAMSD